MCSNKWDRCTKMHPIKLHFHPFIFDATRLVKIVSTRLMNVIISSICVKSTKLSTFFESYCQTSHCNQTSLGFISSTVMKTLSAVLSATPFKTLVFDFWGFGENWGLYSTLPGCQCSCCWPLFHFKPYRTAPNVLMTSAEGLYWWTLSNYN